MSVLMCCLPPFGSFHRPCIFMGSFVRCTQVYQGSQCGKKHGGWSCPPEAGCPGGDCTGEWKDFVKAHNVYRCMHDASPIVWNEAVPAELLRKAIFRSRMGAASRVMNPVARVVSLWVGALKEGSSSVVGALTDLSSSPLHTGLSRREEDFQRC